MSTPKIHIPVSTSIHGKERNEFKTRTSCTSINDVITFIDYSNPVENVNQVVIPVLTRLVQILVLIAMESDENRK